jgi:hypothetical protein
MKDDTDIIKYSRSQKRPFDEICELLRAEIGAGLPKATSRIYYSIPVWFIDGNPIVGYRASLKHVMLLFWSGQSFKSPGLTEAGKFKAAKVLYQKIGDVDVTALRCWLKEAKVEIWDYKDILKNKGVLKKAPKGPRE